MFIYFFNYFLFQTATDQLLMHFASAIHNTAFMIVLEYAEKDSSNTDKGFQKRQYVDLCKVSYETYFSTYVQINFFGCLCTSGQKSRG